MARFAKGEKPCDGKWGSHHAPGSVSFLTGAAEVWHGFDVPTGRPF
jgi:hypothetical protein